MDKLKFMAKCLLVILPVICLIGYARMTPLSYVDSEAATFIWNKKYCNSHHDKEINTIILGDSTANASYMPEVLSDDVLNLAQGGTSPMENYYTMQDWLKHNKAPKDVFISFLDCHLVSSGWYFKRGLYSHRFSLEQNWEMLQAGIKNDERSVITDHYYLDFIAYNLYFPNKYMISMADAGWNQRLNKNTNVIKQQERHYGRYMAIGTTVVREENKTIQKNFGVKSFFDDYYRRLIKLCLDNNIRVHIITLPVPTWNDYRDKYREEYWTYYRALQRDFPEITIEWPNEYFGKEYFNDHCHVNNHGALRFSMWLRSRYPEIFSDILSDRQVEAINDNISMENYFLELCKWVTFEPYVMLIHDGTGRFQEIYEKDMGIISASAGFENRKLYMRSLSALGQNFYTLSPTSEGLAFSDIESHGKSIMIYPKGLGVDENKFEWKLYAGNVLEVLVIDRRNGKVVTAKTFYYNENGNLILQKK